LSEALKITFPRPLRRVFVKRPPVTAAANRSADVDIDAERKEAFDEGFQAASREWTARLSGILKSLDREAAQLNACRQDFVQSLEQSVVDLALAVAEKFLIGEREQRHYEIRAIFQSVIERLDDKGGRLNIALHPEDLERLGEDAEFPEAEAFSSIRLAADPSVPPAGCRVDTGLGRVAFNLEEQMAEIRKMLTESEVLEYESRDA
jgi:flagellar assembly protein FliH